MKKRLWNKSLKKSLSQWETMGPSELSQELFDDVTNRMKARIKLNQTYKQFKKELMQDLANNSFK